MIARDHNKYSTLVWNNLSTFTLIFRIVKQEI